MSDSGNEELSKKHSHKKSDKMNEKVKEKKQSKSIKSSSFDNSKKAKLRQRNESGNDEKQRRRERDDNKSRTIGDRSESEYEVQRQVSERKKSYSKKSKSSRSVDASEERIEKHHYKDDERKSRNSENHDGSKRGSDYKTSREEGKVNDENYEERRNKAKLAKKKSNDKYDESSSFKHKKQDRDFESEEEREDFDYSRAYLPKKNDMERGFKETGKQSDKRHSVKKSNKKNNDHENTDDVERGGSQESDENYRSSGGEKPLRYWSTTRGPVRKNSDSYWNKYSERLNEPPEALEHKEHVAVGPRYYSSGGDENSRREKKRLEINRARREDKRVADIETSKGKNISEKTDVEKPDPLPMRKKPVDVLTSRTGGAYIPPAKLRMMQESITDKGSAAFQRLAWEALKKSIQGHVNKVNTSNIAKILKAIQKENIVRGRGLLCRSLIQAQAASPTFTNVYAAFVAVLNAKFPKLGELLLKRLVVQFRRGFKRNDKTICITAATFIAHLVNQEVAHEIIALEMLTLLIETPTDDSVEVAIAFLKECGMKLTEVSSKGVMAIFDMLRNILHEGNLEKRVQYMIEVMFQVRKEDFKAHPALVKELDLVEDDDKIQHMVTLEENHDPEDILNVFKFDPNYEENEAKYKSLVDIDSDEENSDEEGSSGSGDSDDDSEEDGEEGDEGSEKKDVIVDRTETNLVALRKTIYLTIQSSLDFEECAHKLLRMELKPGQEIEMAHMFLDCCAEQRTYEKFYGLLSQRFCQINRAYIGPFEQTFRDSYETIHRMTNDKLRNVAKLFAHLLYTDAISWEVLATIRLNEDDTTSSSRIFIKILFLELSEYMGLAKLNQRVKDPSLQTALEGLFPRDNPKHTRFAINFFTSIGLGGLTDELREHLKAQPKPSLVPQLVEGLSSSSSSDSSDSSESSSSSDSSSSESSSSESEDSSKKNKRKRKQNNKKPAKKERKGKMSTKRKDSPARKKTKRER